MDYLYEDVDELEGHSKVGNRQCVALIQYFTRAPNTSFWHQGANVMATWPLKKGTAIATFIDGKYPSNKHGNHAAFFLRHEAGGIWVMDQWDGPDKKHVSARFIRARKANANRSNNANAFSVIE